MPVKIKSTSGSVTLDAQNVSGDQTLTVPSLSGGKTLLTTDGDGSSLTGVGVDGIVSSANATAITIDSSERVALGSSTPSWAHFGAQASTTGAWSGRFENTHSAGLGVLISTASTSSTDQVFELRKGTSTTVLKVTGDGRGLSQFTAKAWCQFNGQGTVAIRDSHNISSIGDENTGYYTLSYTNSIVALGAAVASASNSSNTYNTNAGTSPLSTSSCVVNTWNNGAAADFEYNSLLVFGD
jgi:hypothetical protein